MNLRFFFVQIKNEETHVCLDTMGRFGDTPLGSFHCHGEGGTQLFVYSKRNEIMSDERCLDASHPNGTAMFLKCHGEGGNQMWNYDEKVKAKSISFRFIHSKSNDF